MPFTPTWLPREWRRPMSESTLQDVLAPATHGRRILGTKAPRKEDDRLLRGEGQFAGDIDPALTAEMAVSRCPYPHARITSVTVAAALELEGVLEVLTGSEVAARIGPIKILRPVPGAPAIPH
jgi:carbon-monoxide dehydrogenase large subunit